MATLISMLKSFSAALLFEPFSFDMLFKTIFFEI